MRRIRWAAGVLIIALFAWPRAAAACIILDGPSFESDVRQAEVIAVGEVIEAGPDTLTLRVDEYWKGWGGAVLSVDNHTHGHCPPWPHSRGPFVDKGARIVALLEDAPAHSDADWSFANGGSMVIVDASPVRSEGTRYGYAETTPARVVKRDVEAALVGQSLRALWCVTPLVLLAYAWVRALVPRRDGSAGPSED
ncbi:MAG TPA: hypothetical protein VGE07_24025 [Herpetosiphonaceae bacterium]